SHRMAVKPPHDVGTMCFHRLEGSPERGGDLAAIFALRQKLYDFALPWSQPESVVLPVFYPLFPIVQKNLRHFGSEEGLVAVQSFNGLDQLARCVGLQYVASHARL